MRTVLFVDEIHRFHGGQEDAFLPRVERGTIVLIGATTENPSFEVNAALLSRCRVYVLHGLGEAELVTILRRALADRERGLDADGVVEGDGGLAAVARNCHAAATDGLDVRRVAWR